MPRIPAHLLDCRCGQGNQLQCPYCEKPMTALQGDRTGKKCSSLSSRGVVLPGVMVGFTFIFEGMSVTLRPVLWSGIDLEVEGPSWSGAECHSIIGLRLLSLQAISTQCVTGKISSLM